MSPRSAAPDPEAKAGSRADFLYADLLELNRLDVLEEAKPASKEHRHDVDPQFVDQPGAQQRLHDADAADHLDGVAAGRALRLVYGRRQIAAREGEGQPL